MKKFIVLSVLVCSMMMVGLSAQAQFKSGKNLLGPHIGLSQYGSTITLGGMFEAPVNKPGDAGPGIIGVSGQINYYSYDFFGTSVTWILFGAFGNYHFVLEDNRTIDPFIGLGLYYAVVSSNVTGYSYGSGVYLGIQAGMRYFFTPNVAGRVMLGNSASFLTLGVDFGI
ncbi:MAG TPA: hypothetical protein VFO76_13405 [Candidatus Kapabacteria bacterium]|nr:hypothetical protein [Candidatus Kapabacteria bacterium]